MTTKVTPDVLNDSAVLARHFADAGLSLVCMVNGMFVASVGSNALTVALKTKASFGASDPSASDPVLVVFRNTTLTSGEYTVVRVTSAVSIVVSSGSTLGTVNAQAHRLYIVGINDTVNFRLGIYNPWDDTNKTLRGLRDNDVYSPVAEGGVGAADSTQTIYTNASVSNKAIVVLGYIESTQAAAGTWVTAPSKVQTMGPGVKRTHDIVGEAYTATGAMTTGGTAVPTDDTIPQITEGNEYMTLPYVPTSAINLLQIEVLAIVADNTAVTIAGSLYQDATANALKTNAISVTVNGIYDLFLKHQMVALSIASTVFRFRAGGASGSVTFNGSAGGRLYGGVLNSYMQVREVFV